MSIASTLIDSTSDLNALHVSAYAVSSNARACGLTYQVTLKDASVIEFTMAYDDDMTPIATSACEVWYDAENDACSA